MNLNISFILFVLCFGIANSTTLVEDFLKQQRELAQQQQKTLQQFLQANLDSTKNQQHQLRAAQSSYQAAYQTNYGYQYSVASQEYSPPITTVSTNPNPDVNTNTHINTIATRNANPNANGVRSVSTPRTNNVNNAIPVTSRSSFAATTPRQSVANAPNEAFNHNLFQTLVPPAQGSNLVYSPASLEMLLAFISTGAAGETQREIQTALQLPNGVHNVASTYQRILQSLQVGNNPKVVMANKVYHSPQLQVKSNELQAFARDYFDSELEAVDFTSPNTASQKINAWVAAKTQNRIQNVITPVAVDPRTESILVNAIYFKAKWAKPFSVSETRTMDFKVNRQFVVPVDMMYNEEVFRYNEFPNLQASVLELPYEDTDLTMLIILPFENASLAQVERSLNQMDLAAISAQLKNENVHVRIPRFSIDFEQDMSKTLQTLGINYLFSDQADLSVFFNSRKPVSTSKVQHKAHITVNEAGSEAAASSFATFVPLSLPAREVMFTADRPFMFAIRNSQAVFFMGHVVSF